jgi:hypothetical protein
MLVSDQAETETVLQLSSAAETGLTTRLTNAKGRPVRRYGLFREKTFDISFTGRRKVVGT